MKTEYRCQMCGCIIDMEVCILSSKLNPYGDLCEECTFKLIGAEGEL